VSRRRSGRHAGKHHGEHLIDGCMSFRPDVSSRAPAFMEAAALLVFHLEKSIEVPLKS
jgi:hypothetical protein